MRITIEQVHECQLHPWSSIKEGEWVMFSNGNLGIKVAPTAVLTGNCLEISKDGKFRVDFLYVSVPVYRLADVKIQYTLEK